MKIKLNNDINYKNYLNSKLLNLSEAILTTEKTLKTFKEGKLQSNNSPPIYYENNGVILEYFDNIALNPNSDTANNDAMRYIIDNLSIPPSIFTNILQNKVNKPFGIRLKTLFKPPETEKYYFKALFLNGG